MKKTMRRAIAVTTAGAAGLAGAIAFQVPAATAAPGDAKPLGERVPFGMGAWSYGSKFIVDGVHVRNLRTAFAEMPCTTYAGNEPVEAGAISDLVPEELTDIVKVDLVDTVNRTYQTDSRIGSLATSTLGKIEIGGVDNPLGLPLPKIVIDGVRSTADAYWDKNEKKYKTQENVDLGALKIEIPREDIPEPLRPVLIPLLDLIDDVQEQAAPVQDLIDQLLGLTEQLGEIEIPGLGAISLRKQLNQVTQTGAVSESYALGIRLLDFDGPEGAQFAPTEIRLGRAYSRIGGPVHGGVFRSLATAFDGSVLEGVLPLPGLEGGLLQLASPTLSLPCEGTQGEVVKSRTFNSGAIIGGLLVNLKGVQFEMMGKQHRTGFINKFGKRTKKGWAEGSIKTTIDELSVPLLGLSLDNVLTSIGIKNQRFGPVKTVIDTVLDEILVDGKPMAQPKPGETAETTTSTGGIVAITSAIRDLRLAHGARVAPVKVALLPDGATNFIDFLVGESTLFLRKNA